VTNRFDDGPHVMAKGDWPVRAGLQLAGSSSRQVTFRDGKEVEDTSPDAASPGKAEQEVGLHSWGEFGPELTVVLADLSKQKFEFAHWEQIDTRLAAVFRYEVPRDASHYSVTYCCVVNQEIARTQTGVGGRNRGTGQAANVPQAVTANTYVETPGYGGTIAIDPATGAVLRITIQAQLSPNDPLLRAETLVDYGPVQIGDREFICPRRSIALSVRQYSLASVTRNDAAWESTLTNAKGVPILLINETKFTDYHRLGSTVRILNDAATQAPDSPAPDAPTEGGHVNAVDLPSTMPASTAELDPARAKLRQLLSDLTRLLMKREFELLHAQEAIEFASTVRTIAGELGAAAATWARISDSIRSNWNI